MPRGSALLASVLLAACASAPPGAASTGEAPLTIGSSFAVDSRVLGERRPVNVFRPTRYGEAIVGPLPVLLLLDGGIDEDFLHVAGLVQILVSDGSMRPMLLVGVPNTVRRRDLTGPTTRDEDRKIAPVVGGSAAFRRFLREELLPAVAARYAVTGERAVLGESLAGLFVVETFFREPDLFDTYLAIDPSVWWNGGELVREADARLAASPARGKAVFLANSSEPELARLTAALAASFAAHPAAVAAFRHVPLPAETHATVHHPASMQALRTMCAPAAAK